jgi:PTS system mannose-specific IIA component
MIGIVIIAHGALATEFKKAVEHVVGEQKQLEALSIGPDDTAESRAGDLETMIKDVNSGSGVVLLTDMFGGTPSNLAISLLKKGEVEVLAGLNLPMLVKLAQVRESMKLDDAVQQASEAARKYITVASQVLGA